VSVSLLAAGPGPAMFLGASMMSFALPYAAFIVSATVLFLLFRARHSLPRLKYLSGGMVSSVTTREPGPVPAPAAARAEAPGSEAGGEEPGTVATEAAPSEEQE